MRIPRSLTITAVSVLLAASVSLAVTPADGDAAACGKTKWCFQSVTPH